MYRIEKGELITLGCYKFILFFITLWKETAEQLKDEIPTCASRKILL